MTRDEKLNKISRRMIEINDRLNELQKEKKLLMDEKGDLIASWEQKTENNYNTTYTGD